MSVRKRTWTRLENQSTALNADLMRMRETKR